MKKITGIISLVAILFVGCAKDSDTSSTTAKTRTELLTSDKWRITAIVTSAPVDYLGNGVFSTNGLDGLPSCKIDNTLLFKVGAVLVEDEGATKCSSSSPQTTTTANAWLFMNNEQEIGIDGVFYTIQELTATTMVLKDKVAIVTRGVSHFDTYTFKH